MSRVFLLRMEVMIMVQIPQEILVLIYRGFHSDKFRAEQYREILSILLG